MTSVVDSNISLTSFNSLKQKLIKEWDEVQQRVIRGSCTASPTLCSKLPMLKELTSNKMLTFKNPILLHYAFQSM